MPNSLAAMICTAAYILCPGVAHGQSSVIGTLAPVTSLEATIDSTVARAMSVPIAGVSIAIARGPAVIFERSYGYSDLERGSVANKETAYEIGSITKQLTAAAILRLAERGELAMDDEVGEYLPVLRDRAEGVTLRHLLTHTSGLSSRWAVSDLTAPTEPRSVADTLASRPLEFVPGERFAYNNNGYVLLGLVIETVTGHPYHEHMEADLLAPLGLTDLRPCDRQEPVSLATGYRHPTRGPAVPEPVERHHATVSFSAGSYCGTASALIAWERALLDGRIVGPEGLRSMTEPTRLAGGREVPYGMGMQRYDVAGRAAVGHGGASPGFVGEVLHVTGDDLTVVVLTNGVYAGQIVGRLTRDLALAALGAPEPPLTDLPLTDEERSRYSGVYQMGPMTIEVFGQGDHLRAQPQEQIATRLLYQGDGVFLAEHDPTLSLAFRGEGPQAIELSLVHGERPMPPARRVP